MVEFIFSNSKIADQGSTKITIYHGSFPLNLSNFSGKLLRETPMKFLYIAMSFLFASNILTAYSHKMIQ